MRFIAVETPPRKSVIRGAARSAGTLLTWLDLGRIIPSRFRDIINLYITLIPPARHQELAQVLAITINLTGNGGRG